MSAEEEDYAEINDVEANFDPISYIKGLVNVCKYTFRLHDRENGKIRKGRQNIIYTMLLNFEEGLKDKTFSDFEDDFLRIFLKNKAAIISDDNDLWLIKGDIKLELPGVKPKAKKEQGTIFLSTIYGKAANMWDKHKSDPLDKEGRYSEFVLLPFRFFRYIYLCILETPIEGTEMDNISDHLDRTETQLGITDRKYLEDFSMGLFGGGIQEGLKSIIKTLFSAATEKGFMGEGADGKFDIDKLISAMLSIFTDTGTMSDLSKEISECTDKKDIIGVLIRKLNNPELVSAVEKATGMEIDPTKITEMIGAESMSDEIGQAIDKFIPLLQGGAK